LLVLRLFWKEKKSERKETKKIEMVYFVSQEENTLEDIAYKHIVLDGVEAHHVNGRIIERQTSQSRFIGEVEEDHLQLFFFLD
jgi:hypothetical protein